MEDNKSKVAQALYQMVRAGKLFREEIAIALIIVLVGTASFGLGRLSLGQGSKGPVSIVNKLQSESNAGNIVKNSKNSNNLAAVSVTETAGEVSSQVVASKNGTAYYFLNCSGISRIKEENKVYFETPKEAEIAGYKKAANCK